MYMVTSKPKRTSLYEGVSHAMVTLLEIVMMGPLEAGLPHCENLSNAAFTDGMQAACHFLKLANFKVNQ